MAAEECSIFFDSVSQDGGNQEGLTHSQASSRNGLGTLQDSSRWNVIREINHLFLAVDVARPAEADPHEVNMSEVFKIFVYCHDSDSVGGASSHEVDIAHDVARPAKADPHEVNTPEDFKISTDCHDLDSVGRASSQEVNIANDVARPAEADPHEVNMPEDVAAPEDYHSDGEASSEESFAVKNGVDGANVVPKAFYLISNNPIRLIVPKKGWKQSKVVEVHNSDHFEVTFHYICHLIDLPFCFNRQSRKLTHCSCHCSLSPEVAILVSNSLGKFFFYNVFFFSFFTSFSLYFILQLLLQCGLQRFITLS